MEKSIIKKIEEYQHEYYYEGLDEIAFEHLKNPVGEKEYEALLDAYGYIYGELWLDYFSEKYWGNKLKHLNMMIGCLSWSRKLTDDNYYDLEYSRNLKEKAKLVSKPDEKKKLFELAEDTINELLSKVS